MALGDDIYSGAAEYGKFNALVGVIFGTIIGIIMIIIGTILLVKHEEPIQETIGTIVNVPSCTTQQDQDTKENYYRCSISVKYNINGVDYTIERLDTKDNIQYKQNDTVKLYYKPSEPKNVKLSKEWSDHVIGGILLGTGLFIAGGSWLWFYIANKYKFAAAAGGVAGAAELFRR